jgi:hypothetical protein
MILGRRVAWALAACMVLVAGTACEDGGRARPPSTTAAPGSTAPPAGEVPAGLVLNEALNLIEQRAFYAERVDWPSVRAEARRRVAASTVWFGYQDGAFTADGRPDPSLAASLPARLPRPRPPVAVLTSRLTGSAGEGVAMAFRGRPGARSFGEATAGVPTGNTQHRLADGAELYLTEAVGVDRTGRAYQARIRPVQPMATGWTRYGTPADPVLAAATRWLGARCAGR